MRKKIVGVGLILGICLWGSFAYAHTMWINATDYSPKYYPRFGTRTKIFFGYGHRYPVDDFLSRDNLTEFNLISPDGDKKEELIPSPGGFLATQLNLKKQGGYIVSAATKPGFYTMYVDKGKIHHKIGPKTGLKGVILSLYYEQYTKCLINAGETKGNPFLNPIGHRVEIIPLENPKNLRGCGGRFLPVKVLFRGKPAKYWKVYATYSGFSTSDDFAYVTSTNSEGVAEIRLTHWGPWLVKTDKNLPASDELKDKCNELHYTATLTFEVP